jgi:competence protein ComEA
MIRIFFRTLITFICLLPWLAFAEPVDINSASAEQLSESLQGVGPAKAAAIVAYRDQHGPFRSPQDLTKVKGIGDSLLEKNQGLINIGQAAPAAVKK